MLKITAIGNLTHDVELKMNENTGKPYAILAERCAAFAWKGCKLAAAGDFETITFADDPQRQPGFLIKASDVEFLSPRKAEGAAQAVEDMSASEDAA